MNKEDCARRAELHYFRSVIYDEAREDAIFKGQILAAIAFAIKRNEEYKLYKRYNKAATNPLRRIFL